MFVDAFGVFVLNNSMREGGGGQRVEDVESGGAIIIKVVVANKGSSNSTFRDQVDDLRGSE